MKATTREWLAFIGGIIFGVLSTLLVYEDVIFL